jgi:hypothetical protein
VRKPSDVVDDERRVCLPGGTEVGVDTEVDLQRAALEPAPAPDREVVGLRHVRDPEHPLVERDRLGFPSGGHRQLHVIDPDHTHPASLLHPSTCCLCGRTSWPTIRGVPAHSFRTDERSERALAELMADGSSMSDAIRQALVDAARFRRRNQMRIESLALMHDEADRAESRRVLSEMDALRSW